MIEFVCVVLWLAMGGYSWWKLIEDTDESSHDTNLRLFFFSLILAPFAFGLVLAHKGKKE